MEIKTERERERVLPGHLPVQPTRAGPAPPAGPAHLLPLVLFLLCQEDEQRRGVARTDAASATSCFPWPPPASPGRVDECPGVVPIRPTSLTLPLLPLSPFPTSPNTLAAADEHHRSHQPSLALPPVPEAPPLTSTPSPPSHTSGRALQRLPRPLLQASAAEIAGDRVPSLTPPRAPRGHRRNPCEPPVDSPLLPASISRPSHRCT